MKTEQPKKGQIARIGSTIATTLVWGDDGKKYWHCLNCHREVEHKRNCPCCGKSIRMKK